MSHLTTTVTSPIIPKVSSTKDTAPKADIVLFVSAIKSNPNGDPDDEGRPRLTDNSHALMTSPSIKRKVRTTVDLYGNTDGIDMFADSKDKNKIFVQTGSIRTEMVKESIDLKRCPTVEKALSAKDSSEEKKKSTPVSRVDRAYVAEQLCDKFYDVRTFGQVLGTVGGITGAVQIEHTISVNELYINDRTLTVSQVANKAEAESKDRTMGHQADVDYALFPIYIHVNAIVAAQNGFTRQDYKNTLELLQEIWDVTNSSGRVLQFEKMFVFEHENMRGNMPMKDIRKAVTIKPKVDNPKSFDDFDVAVDQNLVSRFNGIHVIEY